MSADSEGSLSFLFDEQVSWRLADILVTLDPALDIESIGRNSHPLRGFDDGQVFSYAVRTGRILISLDVNQTKDKFLASLIAQMGVRAVYLTHSFPTSDPREQAIWLLKRWPEICELAAGLSAGQVIKFTKSGGHRLITVRDPSATQ